MTTAGCVDATSPTLRCRTDSHKARPLGGDTFRSLFRTDAAKRDGPKDETEDKTMRKKVGTNLETHGSLAIATLEANTPQIKDVQYRLDELGITDVSVDHIRDIMSTKYAEGDPGRTAEFIDIEQRSSTGALIPYNPQIHMVGAENRGNVTCYLDSLLFAMFAKIDAFECILKNDFPANDSRSKLVNLLRLWVNMLRTGKLIKTDMVWMAAS